MDHLVVLFLFLQRRHHIELESLCERLFVFSFSFSFFFIPWHVREVDNHDLHRSAYHLAK